VARDPDDHHPTSGHLTLSLRFRSWPPPAKGFLEYRETSFECLEALRHLSRRLLPSPGEIGAGALAAAGELLPGSLSAAGELDARLATEPRNFVQ